MSNADRPRILITRAEDVLGERWDDYAACIARAGGDPIAADLPAATAEGGRGIEAFGAFDGLVVTAGVDIDPTRYGQPRSDRVREIEPRRDAFEEALLEAARAADLPILAICRGIQVLNTSRGGTLLQHLEERDPHRARRGPDGESIDSGWHDVAVQAGSLLARVTGADSLHVNSRHHQAVLTSTVAPDLVATGTAEQEVVEALEDPALTWALGIQWHPERPEMADNPAMHNASIAIFEAFVAACHARRQHAAVDASSAR
ncbi:MAG: gamma-glutamyl-gamma-aminobutyrate hydrolase family protein [Chloroflexi bacterium]|nr:gamma-glutamyl-gamma-aminobutyrate hydrolase family protein [Chloroflexota bacterium]MDA1146149.1 gamma-glutamyl-gamma-aminobutyrate hydrolase family protein [Chloroflexota bacterium]